MVFEFEVGFLFGTMKVGEVRTNELPIVFQGKQSHWYIAWKPVRTELTAINYDDSMVLI